MHYSDDPLIDAPAPSLHFMNTPTANQPKWNTLFVQSLMPKKLEALHKISRNIWWCWHNEALSLFANIDAVL